MRLILLSCALIVSVMTILPIDWQSKLEELKNKNEKNLKTPNIEGISEQTKALLQKALSGVDPEVRRAKLSQLAEKSKEISLSPKKLAEIKEKIANIKPIKTEKPPTANATNLFEVNELAGISDYLFEGDINLTEAQLDKLLNVATLQQTVEGARVKRQATARNPRWPEGKVYYYTDFTINARKRNSIAAALQYIEERTCIRFYENSTNPNRIKVYSGLFGGCSSAIGMTGGEQLLSLGSGCEVMGTVAHEFTHALGFWHTQSRSDRDDYVTVDIDKVQTSKIGNFAKLATNEASNLVPYEYGSFMHYGANFFVQNASDLSIIPADTRYVYTMGSQIISFYDILNINDFYECSAACPTATSAQCKNGGVPNPNNCSTCNCPLGYEGDLCDQRPVGSPVACGKVLKAKSLWFQHEFSYGNATDDEGIRDEFTMCTHWITAPVGKKIQIALFSMWNTQCGYGCPFQGIEFKVNADPEGTNPRICCPEFNNIIYTGSLNPMPVIAWNRYHYTKFAFDYRYI